MFCLVVALFGVFLIALICDFCGCSGAKVAKTSGFLFCVFATCVVIVFVGTSFERICVVCGLCCLGGDSWLWPFLF